MGMIGPGVKRNPLYSKEYNCSTFDLEGLYPPAEIGEEGSTMYVWDLMGMSLHSIFKKVYGVWCRV